MKKLLNEFKPEYLVYLFFLSLPLSIPLTRLVVKLFLVWFVVNLFVSKAKFRLSFSDFAAFLFPTYQSFALSLKGEFLSFLRAPNGLVPVVPYLFKFTQFKVVKALTFLWVSSALLALGVILQSLLGMEDFRVLKFSPFSFSRPSHTFLGHPLTAGAFISTGLLLSLYFLVKRGEKVKGLLLSALFLVALFFTYDRSYWVATFLVLTLVTFLVVRSFRLMLLFALLTGALFFSVPQLKERLSSIFDTQMASNLYRIAMWKGALSFYSQAPLSEKLFGVGRKGYYEQVKPFVESAEEEVSLKPHLFSHLHNDYLTVLVWYGAFGLLLFLFTFGYFIYLNLKAYLKSGSYETILFLSFYLVILTAGLFEYNFEDEAVKFLIYSFFALNVKSLASLEER
jgi:O-antigen ligase